MNRKKVKKNTPLFSAIIKFYFGQTASIARDCLSFELKNEFMDSRGVHENIFELERLMR